MPGSMRRRRSNQLWLIFSSWWFFLLIYANYYQLSRTSFSPNKLHLSFSLAGIMLHHPIHNWEIGKDSPPSYLFKFKLSLFNNKQKAKLMNPHHHITTSVANSCNYIKTKQTDHIPAHVSSSFANHHHKNLNFQSLKPRADGSEHDIPKKKSTNLASEKIVKYKGDLKLTKINELVERKKQCFKKNPQKRPQTPDPISSQKMPGIQIAQYPKPEIILKEIQKNVNFLKQMYFASLSHQSSLSQKYSSHIQNQSHLAYSQHSSNPVEQILRENANRRKSFETSLDTHKKSIPEISLMPCFQPNLAPTNRALRCKNYQQFISGNQGKQPFNAQKELEVKEMQDLTKNEKFCRDDSGRAEKKQRKKSNKKFHKNQGKGSLQDFKRDESEKLKNQREIGGSENTSKTKQKTKQKTANIDSLFEIFKYYKRSIDSSLSKRPSTANLQQKNQNWDGNKKLNAYVSNKSSNFQSKQTPNNSTTKNTTNLKSSTTSRVCGSSIEASVQASVEEDFNHNTKLRKDSTSNSAPKNNIRSKDMKKKREKQQNAKLQMKESRNKSKTKVLKGKDSTASNLRASKEKQNCMINKRTKQVKQKQKEQEIYDKKLRRKETSCKMTQKQKISGEVHKNNKTSNLHEQLKKEDPDQNTEPIDFPQIQSSLFDKNMPILEQDSRQEASSELIASGSQNIENFIAKKQEAMIIENFSKVREEEGTNKQKQAFKIKRRVESGADFQSQMLIQCASGGEKGFQSSCLADSEAEKIEQFNPESIGRKNKNFIANQSEDSLIGCQIPKRDSESDLDNYELVSFEL